MKIREFFGHCRAVVRWPWMAQMDDMGVITLVHQRHCLRGYLAQQCNYVRPIQFELATPLCVVAHELTGFVPAVAQDVWKAARRLGLSSEIATLILIASSTDDRDLDPRTADVRAELVEHLFPMEAPVHISRISDIDSAMLPPFSEEEKDAMGALWGTLGTTVNLLERMRATNAA